MPLIVDDDDVPDMLRGLRKLIVEEEKDAKKARDEQMSYAPQLENAVTHLKFKLAKYEKRDKERKQ
jgi:hypothetical protein